MNWTGGRLHRHTKTQNSLIKVQKQHFAKARLQLQNGVQAPSPFRFAILDETLGQTKEPWLHDKRQTQLSEYKSRENIGAARQSTNILQDSHSKVGQPKSEKLLGTVDNSKRKYRHLSEFQHVAEHGPDDEMSPNLSSPQGRPQVEHPYSRSADDNRRKRCNVAAAEPQTTSDVRRGLLRRSDWVGISAKRPVRIQFESVEDREKIGRRRRKTQTDRRRRQPAHLRQVFQPSLDNRFWKRGDRNGHSDLDTADISIRVGEILHQSPQTWTSHGPNKTTDMSHDHDRQSSESMLLDREATYTARSSSEQCHSGSSPFNDVSSLMLPPSTTRRTLQSTRSQGQGSAPAFQSSPYLRRQYGSLESFRSAYFEQAALSHSKASPATPKRARACYVSSHPSLFPNVTAKEQQIDALVDPDFAAEKKQWTIDHQAEAEVNWRSSHTASAGDVTQGGTNTALGLSSYALRDGQSEVLGPGRGSNKQAHSPTIVDQGTEAADATSGVEFEQESHLLYDPARPFYFLADDSDGAVPDPSGPQNGKAEAPLEATIEPIVRITDLTCSPASQPKGDMQQVDPISKHFFQQPLPFQYENQGIFHSPEPPARHGEDEAWRKFILEGQTDLTNEAFWRPQGQVNAAVTERTRPSIDRPSSQGDRMFQDVLREGVSQKSSSRSASIRSSPNTYLNQIETLIQPGTQPNLSDMDFLSQLSPLTGPSPSIHPAPTDSKMQETLRAAMQRSDSSEDAGSKFIFTRPRPFAGITIHPTQHSNIHIGRTLGTHRVSPRRQDRDITKPQFKIPSRFEYFGYGTSEHDGIEDD